MWEQGWNAQPPSPGPEATARGRLRAASDTSPDGALSFYSIKKLRPWKRSAKTSRIGSRKSGTVSLEAGHLAKGEVSSTLARFVESESAAFQANSRVSEGLRNVL